MSSLSSAGGPASVSALWLSLGLAPWAEEVLFRRGLQDALRPRVGAARAVIVTALAFAAAHALALALLRPSAADASAMAWALATVGPALAIGWVYARTGSLWICVALHAACNAAWWWGATRVLGWALAATLALPGAALAADLARGSRLYTTYCLDCHGAAREPVNATSLNARHSVPVLLEGIANARSGMLFLRDVLSPQDLSDLVAYLGTSELALDFGRVPADAPEARRRVVLKAGREDLQDLVLTVQGDFARVGGDCGARLPAQASCSVELAFRPLGDGERQGVLRIAHPGLGSAAQLPLSGTAAPPADARPQPRLSLDPEAVDFGSQTVGTASAPRSVVATNRGSAPLVWLSRIAPAGGFAVTDDCGDALAPGAQCRFSLRFTPLTGGPVSAELVLATNDPAGARRLLLLGSGVAAAARLRWEPAEPSVRFPAAAPEGSVRGPQLFLRNDGPGAAQLEGWRIAGPQAGEFVVGDGASCRAGLRLEAGAACSLPLAFRPRGLGERRATLSLQTSGEAPVELELVGAGSEPPPPAVATNLGAGGCTIGGARAGFDPLWWLMTAGALAVLAWRRRGAAGDRGDPA